MPILGRAELLLQASNYSGSGDWLDQSGNSHDAQLGSTGGADANDPLFLEPDGGEQFLYLPGTAGNFASTPDSAAVSVTGDIDIRWDVALPDWTPATTQYLGGKTADTTTREWYFEIETLGKIKLTTSPDGTSGNQITFTSSAAVPASDGGRMQLRVTVDVDNGAGGSTYTAYYRAAGTELSDSSGWTQLGAAGTEAVTSIFDGDSLVTVGAIFNGSLAGAAGQFYGLQIYDGIAGTLVFDADFTDRTALTEPFATFLEKSSNGATVTINRSATGVTSTVVDRAMFVLDGTDDYMVVADHASLDFATDESFTAIIVTRGFKELAHQTVLSKWDNAATTGWYMQRRGDHDAAIASLNDSAGYVSDVGADLTGGWYTFTIGAVRNATADTWEVFQNGVGTGSPATDTSTLTLANATYLSIGSLPAVGQYYLGQVMAVALWREALTDEEIAEASLSLAGEATTGGVVLYYSHY